MVDKIDKKLPELKGLVDNKAEVQLYLSFKRVYEYVDFIVKQLGVDLEKKIQAGQLTPADVNDLVGVFSTPLTGSTTTDPLLQSILQTFGSQLANTFLAAPNGSAGPATFRTITLGDIPAGTGITNGAPVDNIPKSDGTNLVPSAISDDGNNITLAALVQIILGSSSLMTIDSSSNLILLNMILLPGADPGISGALWNNAGVLNVSP